MKNETRFHQLCVVCKEKNALLSPSLAIGYFVCQECYVMKSKVDEEMKIDWSKFEKKTKP